MGPFPAGSHLLDVGDVWMVFGWHEQQVQPLLKEPGKGALSVPGTVARSKFIAVGVFAGLKKTGNYIMTDVLPGAGPSKLLFCKLGWETLSQAQS